jgi:hypothetical protein
MSAIGKVSLRGIVFEDHWLPFNISGAPTTADVGKAVALDVTAPNTVKLAGDQDRVFGRLEAVEVRGQESVTVCTVSTKFCDVLPAFAAEVFIVGDSAVGGGAGTVKVRKVSTVDTPDPDANQVMEVLANGDVVVLKS